MERLTYFKDGYWRVNFSGVQYQADFVDRLAAYEDIAELCGGFDRLRELAEADKDGRVVVQPCKIGDKLYRVFAGEIFEHRVGKMKYFAIQKKWDIETYPFCPCVESSINTTETSRTDCAICTQSQRRTSAVIPARRFA